MGWQGRALGCSSGGKRQRGAGRERERLGPSGQNGEEGVFSFFFFSFISKPISKPFSKVV
jgi:hypothetical protein